MPPRFTLDRIKTSIDGFTRDVHAFIKARKPQHLLRYKLNFKCGERIVVCTSSLGGVETYAKDVKEHCEGYLRHMQTYLNNVKEVPTELCFQEFSMKVLNPDVQDEGPDVMCLDCIPRPDPSAEENTHIPPLEEIPPEEKGEEKTTQESDVIINTTPHDVKVETTQGTRLFKAESKHTIRAASQPGSTAATWQDMNLTEPQVITGVEHVSRAVVKKAHTQKHHLICSQMAAEAILMDQPDFAGRLLVPDTRPGMAVRDSQGRILGVKALVQHHPPLKKRKIVS